MIPRDARKTLVSGLDRQAAAVLIGPRQVGKTTLAMEIAASRPSVYLDLESPSDRAKLTDPEGYLEGHADKLLILDEIHRLPEIFQTLRGIIDRGRRTGRPTGRFLILGSASLDLLKQSGETLAGRITYVELGPVHALELANDAGAHSTATVENLWLRGGFPGSLLAEDDASSLQWRQDFIRTYLERDIPQFGPRVPAETLSRMWTMLAHLSGDTVNASNLARGLDVSTRSVNRYMDLLVDLLLVRRLMPHHANVGKRLVKSPRIYLRDTGLLHALLNLPNAESIAGHSIVGKSWETFVMNNLLEVIPPRTTPSFYRTSVGAEIDLLLHSPRGECWGIEIKRGLTPKLQKGFHEAKADVEISRAFVVYSGDERYRLSEGVEAIPLVEMMKELRAWG